MREDTPPAPAASGAPGVNLLLRVCLPFLAGYFLSYVYRAVNAVLGPQLAVEFSLSAADLGLLTGAYFFADYVSGNVWSVQRTAGAPVVERLAGEVSIVGLLPDPAGGDILLLDRGNNGVNPGTGSIKRLTVGTDDSSFPPTLAATNFFADLADLTPNPGGHFYEPNLRFWSDHAEKKRWFLIQNTTDTVGYAPDAPWTYPAGMIWVKHFDYPTQWESFTRTVDGQPRTDRRPVAGSPRRRGRLAIARACASACSGARAPAGSAARTSACAATWLWAGAAFGAKARRLGGGARRRR